MNSPPLCLEVCEIAFVIDVSLLLLLLLLLCLLSRVSVC